MEYYFEAANLHRKIFRVGTKGLVEHLIAIA